MEPGFELEDDVFFADLSKRISLLIMDDDDDGGDDDENCLSRCPAEVNLQAFHQALIHPARSQASTFQNYDHHHHHQQQQQITSKREISKGTGVFIPLSSHPRRRNAKQGRSLTAAPTSKCQRQTSDNYTYNPRGLPNNISYDYNNNSSVNCRSQDSFHQ